MHSVESIYAAIVEKNPELTSDQLDDILATLEHLQERYIENYFNEESTLSNVIRLVGNKFIITRDVITDIISENLHGHGNITTLQWALENQESVFKKIDFLEKLQKTFSDYPKTNLPQLVERTLTVSIAHTSPASRKVVMEGGSIGDLILADPKNLYYFMP